jgi:hypothetical protein
VNNVNKENIKPKYNIKNVQIPIKSKKSKSLIYLEILTSEEIELEKIKKEKENFKLLKMKNEQAMERAKIFTPQAINPVPLTYLYPFNFTDINTPKSMLKKKRDENENLLTQREITENLINKEKSYISKKKAMILNKSKNKNRSRSPVNFDEELNDLSKNFDSITLNRTPRNKTPLKASQRDSIPSPVRFKLPSTSMRNHFK